MEALKIRGTIKEYDWGSKDFLPGLFGYPETGKPQAEAWFGTHPLGEALLEDGRTLSSLISEDPEKYLGRTTVDRLGNSLPMLFKVLAISTPLSIQCHPTREIAREGYAKEAPLREKGVPLSELNYKDPNQKAEVIYALTPVTAMCGFRSFDEIVEDLGRLIPAAYAKYFSSRKNIAQLFERLYTLSGDDLSQVIDEYVDSLARSGEPVWDREVFLTRRGIAERAWKLYGYDPGLLCPYLLNVMELDVGEALYLEPRTLHAYVLGNGIELMSLSDNVLRGGLTHKKVDVPELMRVMIAEPFSGGKAQISPDAEGRSVVRTPSDDFLLKVMSDSSYVLNDDVPSMLLCTDGSAKIGSLELRKGECCFVPACIGKLEVFVSGRLFQATVPTDEELGN